MKNKKWIFLLIILAFAVRLAVFLYFRAHQSIQAWEYDAIARNLVNGYGFKNIYLNTTYYSCTTPLYPFICAIVYKLFGINHDAIIILQIIVSSLICILVFDLGRRIASSKVGLIAGWLYVFHPGLIIYSTLNLHALILDAFLFLSTVWSFVYLREALTLKRSLLTGTIAGLCILTRSTVIVFIPFGFIWLFLCYKKDNPKKVIINIISVLIVTSLLVSGWVIRNFLVHKEFVFMTTTDAEVFWRGNNINATGTSHIPSGGIVIKEDRPLYNKIMTLSELEQRNLFRTEAINFIRKNPGKFIELFFKKLFYFWWFSPESGIYYPKAYLLIYKFLYSIALFFAIIGIYSTLKSSKKTTREHASLILLFLLIISLTQSLFYVEGRHRWAVEPLLLIFTATGYSLVLDKNKERGEKK
ncbi:MAG: glycosyltransferase family 39 protein [Candidatus Omnitrophica bacterium]|nr:glycosyltransferase family 39 protein [Candidatus Omnitrophota bacterium]MDD5237754.1 glycosyltransferase family 39 protein [Candidatus Omnitrophota bacterium]